MQAKQVVTVHTYSANTVVQALVAVLLPFGSRFYAYGASTGHYAPSSLTPNLNSYGASLLGEKASIVNAIGIALCILGVVLIGYRP